MYKCEIAISRIKNHVKIIKHGLMKSPRALGRLFKVIEEMGHKWMPLNILHHIT